MHVKTYRARDVKQAMAMVRADLGPDAVIVATRSIKKGPLGRAEVEVTASHEATDASPMAIGSAPSVRESTRTRASFGDESSVLRGEDLASLVREVRAMRATLELRDAAPDSTGEVDELRDLLVRALSTGHAGGPGASRLMAYGIDPAIADALTREVGNKIHGAERDESLRALIARRFASRPWKPPAARPTCVAVVGPTGVGKTTTLAKLAARAALVERRRVALICADAFRVGARDQMARFASLIGLPLAVARDRPTLSKAIAEHPMADLFLIDTEGRSPHDDRALSALASMLEGIGEMEREIHLVLPVATPAPELRLAISRYRALGPTSLVLTKLDETVVRGGIVNAAELSKLPLAYVTTGQRVPEDIAVPSAQWLAALVLSENEAQPHDRPAHEVPHA